MMTDKFGEERAERLSRNLEKQLEKLRRMRGSVIKERKRSGEGEGGQTV